MNQTNGLLLQVSVSRLRNYTSFWNSCGVLSFEIFVWVVTSRMHSYGNGGQGNQKRLKTIKVPKADSYELF